MNVIKFGYKFRYFPARVRKLILWNASSHPFKTEIVSISIPHSNLYAYVAGTR